MASAWRMDLSVNAQRKGLVGAVIAWLAFPGFKVATLYRVARRLRPAGALGRVGSVLCCRGMARYGCFISPRARIGPALRLPHPTGIVIGEDVVVGSNVTVYQNVTLGRVAADLAEYPIVEDDVVIYAGAVIVGAVRIGRGATIGANSVVNANVAPGDVVAGVPARPLRRKAEIGRGDMKKAR